MTFCVCHYPLLLFQKPVLVSETGYEHDVVRDIIGFTDLKLIDGSKLVPPPPQHIILFAFLIHLDGTEYLSNEPKACQDTHTPRNQQHRRAHEEHVSKVQ